MSLLAISKHDGGGGIESVHILLGDGLSESTHSLSGSFHSSHGQRKRRAIANFSICNTPKTRGGN
jgi:hypothetical protein